MKRIYRIADLQRDMDRYRPRVLNLKPRAVESRSRSTLHVRFLSSRSMEMRGAPRPQCAPFPRAGYDVLTPNPAYALEVL